MKGVTRFGGLSGVLDPGQSNKPNTRSLQGPVSARNTPVDAANASIEQRLRSSDPPEAAAPSAGAADQVGFMTKVPPLVLDVALAHFDGWCSLLQ